MNTYQNRYINDVSVFRQRCTPCDECNILIQCLDIWSTFTQKLDMKPLVYTPFVYTTPFVSPSLTEPTADITTKQSTAPYKHLLQFQFTEQYSHQELFHLFLCLCCRFWFLGFHRRFGCLRLCCLRLLWRFGFGWFLGCLGLYGFRL